jgi:hypothetical protein
MAPSSIQLARLVQAYVAEPGGSLEEKATRIGVRRNELLRAARGTISRTTRLRLLASFAAGRAPAGSRSLASRRGSGLRVSGNADFHELRSRPGVARPAVVP